MAEAGEYRRRIGVPNALAYSQDLYPIHTRQHTSSHATTHEQMTPCKRGVSDLGCGRGHDRRRGQISWSLTPRSPRWRGDDRVDGERSAKHADRGAREEKPPLHIDLQ
jgi:hypothetical protein